LGKNVRKPRGDFLTHTVSTLVVACRCAGKYFPTRVRKLQTYMTMSHEGLHCEQVSRAMYDVLFHTVNNYNLLWYLYYSYLLHKF